MMCCVRTDSTRVRTESKGCARLRTAALPRRMHHISRLVPALLALGMLLGLLCGAAPTLRAQQPDEATQVLVVPLHEQISTTHLALVQRALRMARSQGIPWLVLDIDTPGGRIDYSRELEALL